MSGTKKVWAKGRKEKGCSIWVSEETKAMANRMAEEAGMTMKEFIFTVLNRYNLNSKDKDEQNS